MEETAESDVYERVETPRPCPGFALACQRSGAQAVADRQFRESVAVEVR